MMNRVKLLLPLLILIGNSIHSKGQQNTIPTTALQTPKEYYLQVKQFGEFIDRFNYKSDWKGNRITDEFARKVPRASYILYLMNSEDERLINPTDSSYRMLCSEFIAYVDNPSNPQAISLFSGQVKAIVKANITYNSKGHTASLEMIPEILPDRSAKWVISRVETDLFRISPDSLQKHFIAPNSHETNFINLRKLNGTTNPYYYTSSVLTKTILFLKEVEQKRIIIENTEKVTYYIHFSGWEITVEEFNRNSNNSGWLISDIKKR